MTKKYKIITVLLIFIVALILILQIDDDIDVEAQKMYEQVTAHKESEAYVYLLGMHAGADDDPKDIGEMTLKSIREFEKSHSLDDCYDDAFEFHEYIYSKRLTLIELNSCEKESCELVDELFAQKFNSSNIPKDQNILLKRYKKYLSFNDLHSLSIPAIEIPLPSYRYLISGSDLVSLIAIDKAKNQKIEESKLMLLSNITGLRHHLAQADTLISKMIYVAALSKSLNVLSILKNMYKDEYGDIIIQPLNSEERSMVKAMIYENGFMYLMNKSLSACPSEINEGLYIPRWAFKTAYKPNMTINMFYKRFNKIGENSLLSSEEFTNISLGKSQPIIEKYVSRNIVGNIVFGYNSIPTFNSYTARVFVLDAKIKLFNESGQSPSPVNISQIKNPFYKSGKFAYHSEDMKSICFDAPYIERDRDRCLRIKY